MKPERLIAEDARMQALLETARRAAPTAATVLITGESGCGKEVVARYLHERSPRAGNPFVAVNCAAIPENLLEATMFGYEKGAFTGATRMQAGKLEQAQGGTLLLDEISEMPTPLQAKLLRVLQEREVERLGACRPISLDVRVLATSNRDLPAEVARGAFREDLYYRLNVITLRVPALRERRADILPMAREFSARAVERFGCVRREFSAAAQAALCAHDWPGNVRELANTVERALILAAGSEISIGDLELGAAPCAAAALSAVTTAPCDMKSLERQHILGTLNAVQGSRKRAVELLGISERTLRYKLQQYRLAGAF